MLEAFRSHFSEGRAPGILWVAVLTPALFYIPYQFNYNFVDPISAVLEVYRLPQNNYFSFTNVRNIGNSVGTLF